MARNRAQAWLTCVTKDESVRSALILAESLRRSSTTKRISVIATGHSVSKEHKLVLRNVFDDVFWLDTSDITGEGSFKKGSRDDVDVENIAKIFAFSLEIFEKCIFLGPNTIVLENADRLFEGQKPFEILLSGTTDLFAFTPNKALCGYLENEYGNHQNGLSYSSVILESIQKWIKNNPRNEVSSNKVDYLPEVPGSVMDFFVQSGQILLKSEITLERPSLVHFADFSGNVKQLAEKMHDLYQNRPLGLIEKIIVETWLGIFETSYAGMLLDPKSSLSCIPTQFNKQVYSTEPIAIIGISCRFAGANNIEEFWKLLYDEQEGIQTPPAFRWKSEHAVFGASGKERHTKAGFLSSSVEDFDAKFFGVSPKEGMFLDPQARILHEVMWESLENSGIDPQSLYGSHTGVFTGSWMNDYKDMVQRSTERDFFRTYMGNSMGATAARLSFLLGLTGPSIATESGCSSAIVAVDLAVKSLRSGETSLALVGGVNLLLHPFESNIIDYVIAPDGRCKTFDEKADGFGRAEGCGVLVLKKLSDALRDRDNIWATIRGSAVTQEGMTRSLGTPTVQCEALSMELALKDAGVSAEQVSFVETHGTGTAVGDPMEVAAIAKAYYSPDRKMPLVIGSVKTNVGHTESCSGITGIIKTVLAMQHELIPKHLNLDTLNPQVNLDLIPAVIPLEQMAWPKIQGQPRLAGVSSFGITGTDGHVIIEEAPEFESPRFEFGMERPLHLLKISGKTKEALSELVQLYEGALGDKKGNFPFAYAAYTGNTGRASFNHRAFLLASNYEVAVSAIQTDKLIRGEVTGTGKICFLFTGQGSQYCGMAKSLYTTSPTFRIHFDHCDRILRETYNLSICEAIWGSDPNSKELSRTIFSQTSIFCVEYSLFKLWQSWGIHPDFVLGHSLGEFCAAVAAGILSLEDAIKLVAERSSLIDPLPRGGMLVIKSSRKDVEKLMSTSNIQLDFAALNSQEQTVVAGDTDKILQLLEICKGQGLKAVVLEATHAFHSRHMDPILDEYGKIAQKISHPRKGLNCSYISGMEGRLLDDPLNEVNADYWVRHTRQNVSFMDACAALRELDCKHFLEIGPQPILSSFMMQNIEDTPISCYPSLRRNTNDWETMLSSLGKLYLQGYKVDWNGFDRPYNRKKVSFLPFHPFYRKPFWVDTDVSSTASIHPLVGYAVSNASNLHIYQNNVTTSSIAYLKDHCIGNLILFPGACFTEMCLSSAYCVANSLTKTLEKPRHAMALENVTIEAPLELKEGRSCRLQTIVVLKESSAPDQTCQSTGFEVKVFHQNQQTEAESQRNWVQHATAIFHPFISANAALSGCNWNPERIKELIDTKEAVEVDSFYKAVENAGLKFGETFKTLQRHWRMEEENGMDEIVVEMRIPDEHEKYILHPLIIDAMIQAGLLSGLRTQSGVLRVPVRIGRLTLFGNADVAPEDVAQQGVLFLHTKWEQGVKCTVFLTNGNFAPVAVLEGLEVIETNVKTIQSVLEIQNNHLPDSWEEIWKPIPGPHENRVELTNLAPIFQRDDFKERVMAISDALTEDDKVQAQQMMRLVYLYSLQALLELGWAPKKGERITVKEFCEKYKILAYFAQQVHFYFTMCHNEDDMMEFKSDCYWEVKRTPPSMTKLKTETDLLHKLLIKVQKLTIVVNIYKNVSAHLSNILSGQESVLPILYPIESENQEYSAEMYYQNYPGRVEGKGKTVEITGTILRHIHELNENSGPKNVLRVLEVGAGTGSMSGVMVATIAEIWGTKFEYYYTDISASFFGKADKKLDDFKQNLKFSVFNIEEPALDQGIPLNYFDLVLASDVLHATKNLQECIINLRQTIKPGGMMYFTECLTQDPGITFVFGLFEGYWRFEDFDLRPHHCCVEEDKWKQLLLNNGFRFVDVSGVYMGVMGCITAEATSYKGTEIPGIIQTNQKNKWLLFSAENDREASMLTQKVSNIMETCGGRCAVEKVVQPATEMTEAEISKLLESAFCTSQSDDEIQGIVYAWGLDTNVKDQSRIALPFMLIAKHLLNLKKPPKLYVLTRGVHSFAEEIHDFEDFNPSSATLFGMSKSLKNESADVFVRYVDLDRCSDLDKATDQVLFELAMNKESRDKERVQVAYRDGVRFEPRFNRSVLQNKLRDDLQLPPSTERYQLVLPKTRVINDLTFDVLQETTPELLGEDEVEVKVKAYALNFRDIFAILKPIAEFENLNGVGLDFAGVITKVGGGIREEGKLKVGDRVFGVHFKDTQLPSHQVVGGDSVLHIPDNISFSEAATLPAVFATSLYCLGNIARMKKGDTVLIHTGSGGVGLSAIQLAKHVGANIITTAGSPRKRRYLKSLGIQHVFHSRNTSYEQDIMRVTNGKGVDIVLNSITGPGLKEATLRACAQNARFVEMSKMAVWTVDEVKERRPDVEYSIVDLTVVERPIWRQLLDTMRVHLEGGNVKPIPYVKFDALRVRQALQYFQKAKHIGKVVVTMPEVKAKDGQWTVDIPLFNSESTYVITGGLGGIGFEVCKWMLSKGATDIVLVGRNPPKPHVAAEIDRLNKMEANNVMVKLGDVADLNTFSTLWEQISAKCKPIRGVHHCAGVLRDNIYANQTWETFSAPYRPKIEGSWNLHQLTKELSLEHFVLYSSITALAGTPAQANHSSANCFEDAFAHYRTSLGLPATTVNWGQWSQVGCAKEVNVTGVLPVSVTRMLNGLEEVLRSQMVQAAFGEFESLAMWSMVVPLFKHYLDERLLKSLKDNSEQGAHVLLKSDKFWQEMDGAPIKDEKMAVVSVYMKVIIRAGLRMDSDEPISDDANMKDLGVDSLMLIELKNSIQSLLGSRLIVSANMLKDCNTIRELAACIVNKLYHNEGEVEAQNIQDLTPEQLEELLQSDCVLDENIQPVGSAPMMSISAVKNVLITGCTGQLGPYILSVLSQNYPSLENISCLIRTREGFSPQEKLLNILHSMNLINRVNMSKVTCIRGDLTQPKFGMQTQKYNELCESIDAVIHLATKSNHVEPYRKCESESGSDLRSVNVEGTKHVLRFATAVKTKYIYYASSIMGIFGGNAEEGKLCDDWPQLSEMSKITENRIPGYPTSKYVCEMLMKEACARGIPCKVFRFPWIMGDSKTGQLNYLHSHYVLRFLSYLKIKSIPMAPIPAIILPVDICAQLSLKLFWNESAPWEIYNIAHPDPQMEVEFVQVAKQDFGTDLELVDHQSKEFIEKLYGPGMPLESLKEVYEDVDRVITITTSNAFQAVQGYMTFPETFFKNEKVQNFAPGFSDGFPTTMHIIRSNLKYVKSKGFLTKFGL